MICIDYAIQNIHHEQQNQAVKHILEKAFLQAKNMLCEIRGNWRAEDVEDINIDSPSDRNSFEWVLIRELVNQLEWMNAVTDSCQHLLHV